MPNRGNIDIPNKNIEKGYDIGPSDWLKSQKKRPPQKLNFNQGY